MALCVVEVIWTLYIASQAPWRVFQAAHWSPMGRWCFYRAEGFIVMTIITLLPQRNLLRITGFSWRGQALYQRSNSDPVESLSGRLNGIPDAFSIPRSVASIPLAYCWLSEYGTDANQPDLRFFPPARKLFKPTAHIMIASAKDTERPEGWWTEMKIDIFNRADSYRPVGC